MSTHTQYTHPEVFQAERRDVFARTWQIVGDLAALQKPGDYVCANLAGFPAFVMRDAQGHLGAFRNECRHQQLPVLDNGAGHCADNVRCRYHGWTYDFTGKCILAPQQVRPDDFGTAEYRLDRIPFAEWHGLVAVNFDHDAEPLTSAFVDVDIESVPATFVSRGIARVFANWKTIVDEMVAGEHRPLPDTETMANGITGLARRTGQDLWLWHAPTLNLRFKPGILFAMQVVPRTFLKSEIHWYLFGEEDAARLDMGAAVVEQLGKAAELRQEQIKAEAGAPSLADQTAADLLCRFRRTVGVT